VIIWQLLLRFGLISILAFGGGAGISLIERTAVQEARWIDQDEFMTALALGQVLPGPLMSVASFVGYRAAGLAGALAATLAVFLLPWYSAATLACHTERLARCDWLHRFRAAAGAAAVGLLGVTALALARISLHDWVGFAVATVTFVLARATKIHPFWLLLAAAGGGMVLGLRG
jgi:chromate transporter